jgi:hypothetical protein
MIGLRGKHGAAMRQRFVVLARVKGLARGIK